MSIYKLLLHKSWFIEPRKVQKENFKELVRSQESYIDISFLKSFIRHKRKLDGYRDPLSNRR